MLTFNPSLKATLDSGVTKAAWANALQVALGNNRRVRCFRDAASGAANASVTGTEFMNVAATGPLTIQTGNIVGLGTLSNITIRNAADLTSGTCVLRIEGANGNWVQGSLGPSGSGSDFIMSGNASASTNTGYAFVAGSGVNSPTLDTGIGPLSPTLTASAPYSVTIEDWTNGTSGVVVGTILLNNQWQNMVFDDPEIALNMGDVKTFGPNTSVTFEKFVFGAVMFAASNQLAASGTEPLYQVLISCKPTAANWPNYPTFSGWIEGTSTTFPLAFKAVIKTQSGTVLYTHQMRDGLPINSPLLSDQDMGNRPMRPWFNCGMMLPWQSFKPNMSSFKAKWHPGFADGYNRSTVGRTHYSTRQCVPLINANSLNGMGNIYEMPKWPYPADENILSTEVNNDSRFNFGANVPWWTVQHRSYLATGWGYEPGAYGPHDRYTGPGGARHDRMVMATPIAIALQDPTFVTASHGDSIQDMIDHWNLNYFNNSYHYVTDVTTFATINFEEALRGIWGNGRTYYGPNDSYVAAGKDKTIPLFAMQASYSSNDAKPYHGAYIDARGHMPWNGDCIDFYHNYGNAAFAGIFWNSPMHAYAAKHREITSMLCQLNTSDGSGAPRGKFLIRQNSWVIMNHVLSWKLTSNHPTLGISRKTVEDRFQRELEAVYDYIYKPLMIDNEQGIYANAVRQLGVGMYLQPDGVTWAQGHAMGLQAYMGPAFVMMKQFGMWQVMMNKSEKCKQALLFTFRCLDMMSAEYVLETDARDQFINFTIANGTPQVTTYNSWKEVSDATPKVGLQDMITSADGTKYGQPGSKQPNGTDMSGAVEQDIAVHIQFQWLSIRKFYFPEIPSIRPNGIDLAYNKYKGYYDFIAQRVAARTGSDWGYRFPGLADFLPPTTLGPGA